MNCLLEILGLALPGNGTILAVSQERRELVRKAAFHLMDLVKNQVKPRDIVTEEAIDDAFALDMAMGGSTNTVLHTLAIANEGEIDYDLRRVNEIAEKSSSLSLKKLRHLPLIPCTMSIRLAASLPLYGNWSISRGRSIQIG